MTSDMVVFGNDMFLRTLRPDPSTVRPDLSTLRPDDDGDDDDFGFIYT